MPFSYLYMPVSVCVCVYVSQSSEILQQFVGEGGVAGGGAAYGNYKVPDGPSPA